MWIVNISSSIRRLFQDTHIIQVFRSIDDREKAHAYQYPELEQYNLQQREELLAERRSRIMEWFYMVPKA